MVCRTDDAEQLVVRTRSLSRFSRLPVLAVSDTLNDLSFATAGWGSRRRRARRLGPAADAAAASTAEAGAAATAGDARPGSGR